MKVLVSWSTGKDSAWMLHRLQQCQDLQLVGLVSTVNAEFERVAMHGVRTELVTQ
ncbi:MAG TPA: ATP-binding protein, partial [Gammaproteobacteria bacterium]|nr:ATP-binding protein [Gammaproteobacteria bacterium]